MELNKLHNDNLDQNCVSESFKFLHCKRTIKIIVCLVFLLTICFAFFMMSLFYKKQSYYNTGIKFLNEKKYDKALNEFILAGDYKNAKEKLNEANRHVFGKLNDCLKQIGIEMTICPAGNFTEIKRNNKSNVRTAIINRPFAIGKYEITQEQYFSVMELPPDQQNIKNQSKPVNVNWINAKKFCEKLNKMFADKLPADYRFDLPTEVQWEYACRAGKNSIFYDGPTEGNFYDVAWNINNSGDELQIVGQKKPNAWGIYDMYGNVWEWCKNTCEKCASKAVKEKKSVEDMEDSCRALRGGSFRVDFLPILSINYADPDMDTKQDIGFRLAFVPVSQ